MLLLKQTNVDIIVRKNNIRYRQQAIWNQMWSSFEAAEDWKTTAWQGDVSRHGSSRYQTPQQQQSYRTLPLLQPGGTKIAAAEEEGRWSGPKPPTNQLTQPVARVKLTRVRSRWVGETLLLGCLTTGHWPSQALPEGEGEARAATMNAASLLESFPKTKTKRFKVIKLSCVHDWSCWCTPCLGETPKAESFSEPWPSSLSLHVGGQPLCQVMDSNHCKDLQKA